MADWATIRDGMADLVYTEVVTTRTQQKRVEQSIESVRAKQQANLLAISREGEVEQLLELERMLLVQEREHLAGSVAMATSLGNAIKELDIALEVVERVRDPVLYKREIDGAFSLDKNRVGGLPRDEARQFFRSHLARLGNLDKGRLSDSERDVLKARMFNIRAAEHQYRKLQEQALGIEGGRDPGKDPTPAP